MITLEKVRFTAVYIIFHFLPPNMDCRYTLEPSLRGHSNERPQTMDGLDKKYGKYRKLSTENDIPVTLKACIILPKYVFLMQPGANDIEWVPNIPFSEDCFSEINIVCIPFRKCYSQYFSGQGCPLCPKYLHVFILHWNFLHHPKFHFRLSELWKQCLEVHIEDLDVGDSV